VAADFSAQMLSRAKTTTSEATFVQLDICQNIPLGGPFDVVFCFNAFPHFRDKAAALQNIAKCLVPSGNLTVLHLAGSEKLNAFHKGLREPICHDLLPSKPEWLELLDAAQLVLSIFEDTESLLLQANRA
jgi:SAM-dependent methyltransferase